MTSVHAPDSSPNGWLRHVWAAVAGAAAGLLAALLLSPAPSPTREPSLRQPPAPLPSLGDTEAHWRSHLPAVRSITGAASETAWVKWAMRIPDDALSSAIDELDPRKDFHALRYLYARWVKVDATAAWNSFRKSKIPIATKHFYIPPLHRREVGMVYGTLGLNPRSTIAAVMLHSWKNVNPSEAVAFAATLRVANTPASKAIPVNSYELKTILGEVTPAENAAGSQDTAELARQVNAASEDPDRKSRSKALNTALRQWMTADPEAACRWILQLPADRCGELDATSLAAAVKKGPASTKTEIATRLLGNDWNLEHSLSHFNQQRINGIDEMPGFSITPQMLASRSVTAWTSESPEQALRFVESVPEGPLKSFLTGEAAGVLLREDPNAAIALVSRLESHQDTALHGLVRAWTAIDAQASLDWITRIEDVPLRDTCLEQATLMIAPQDLGRALGSSQRIEDPDIRRRIREILERQLAWNPAALAHWRTQITGLINE